MINLNFLAIGVGITVGTITRYLLLKDDYRNYPSFPNGYLIHLTVGFVAAALGSVAVPAILNEDFVAVTFLALAIQQFREVRKMEKESLLDLEDTEQIPRGSPYIDGLAKSFEARNYVVLLTALVTSGTILFVPSFIGIRILIGILVGLSFQYGIAHITKDKQVGDVADVYLAKIEFRDYDLFVDDIFLTNIGLAMQRDWILEKGIGVIIEPRNVAASITLINFGSRQAIIHEVARVLGVKQHYQSRRDFSTERIGLFVVAVENDSKALLEVIKQVPLLESVRRKKILQLKEEE